MYILTGEQSFDSAHFLKGYDGKCSNIHGHRWRVCAEVFAEELIEEGQCRGMVVDFGDLKNDLKEIVDVMDHALIIEENSMREETLNCLKADGFSIIQLPFRTTAENMSKYFYKELEKKEYKVKNVKVYETPTNCAIYEEVL